jgi:hypothetical protein
LVALLAVARLVAPEPSADQTQLEAPAPVEASASTESGADSALLALRPIDFSTRRGEGRAGSRASHDLLDPFTTRPKARTKATAKATAKAAPRTRARTKAQRRRNDLRDPFAQPASRGVVDPAPDLRDPFERRKALPKCPDTGGVPIQRPATVDPGCLQASRRIVLARGRR